jgi:hypothetical protein
VGGHEAMSRRQEERAEKEADAYIPTRSASKATEFAAECDAIAKCKL